MTCRKRYSIDAGIILVDILLAISLAMLFTAIVTESSGGARQIFDQARERARLLDVFEQSMLIGSLSTTSALFASSSRRFGNDRIENDIVVSSISSMLTQATSSPFSQSLSFVKVGSRYPSSTIADSAGAPLCAVDFSNHNVIGSYSFLNSTDIDSTTISITPIMLPINPLLPLTDIEVRNGVAYVSDDSSTASDPDLFAIDFKDRANPVLLSSINTGPGISAIAIAGNRIYAAAASTAAQLHIIRMDSLNSLTLEKKYQLPPPYATATEPMAGSIFFGGDKANGDKIYLGTEKWDGNEFSIIDVSNPTSPVKIGGFETGSKVNDIFARDGIAYVADSDQNQMRVINVSQPSASQIIGLFSPSGWSRQEGKTLSYFEDSLVLGRTSGGFDITTDHEAFAWATTSAGVESSPFIFSSDPSAYHSINIPGGVYGMLADRSRVYLATRQVNKELQIFDRALSTSTATYYPLPVAPQTLTCDGDHLYILAATAPVIYEISFK